jgi:hypothetical protein
MLKLCHKVICDAMRGADPIHRIIPCFGILEQAPYLGKSFGLIYRRRTFYGMIGSVIGIYLNSTAALGEVEEVSKDLGGSINSISSIPSGLSIDLLVNDDDNISDKDVVKFHLDEDIIPETVWSLHSNNPVHVDRIRNGVETHIDMGTGAHFDNPSSWIRSSFASSLGAIMYTSGDLLSVTPLQFQVASCGGNHAERRDLDYCSTRDALRQEIEQQNLSDANDGNTTLVTNNNVVSTKVASSSYNANDQSTPLSSTPATNPSPHGGMIALDPCGGASGVCAVVDEGLPAIVDTSIDVLVPPIDALAPPIDALAPPIGALAPPIGVLAPPPTLVPVVDDPGPGLGLPPTFTSQPLKPIPEASTWVMTIIGFSIIALAFRKKRRTRIYPISIIDIS